MNTQKGSKLNRLEQSLPEGLMVDSAWLERHGYYRSLRRQYVSSGWLQQPVRGVFRRPRGEIGWEQVIISLQALMGYAVTIGGSTALELQGFAHYIPQSLKKIHLYSEEKLPSWVQALPLAQKLVVHNRQRLFPLGKPLLKNWSLDENPGENALSEEGFRITPWGQWRWPMVISSSERAYLEMLDEIPRNETFHMADVIMEGLVNISPRRMQALLAKTKSIKVKRLFFFFADRHQHSWLKYLNQNYIDLGSGKRVVVKGGKLNSVYQITVPEEFMEKKEHDV